MFGATRAKLHATEGADLGRCSGATAPLSARNYDSPDVSIATVPTYQSSFPLSGHTKQPGCVLILDPRRYFLMVFRWKLSRATSKYRSRDVLNRSGRAIHPTGNRDSFTRTASRSSFRSLHFPNLESEPNHSQDYACPESES